jgi:hypothetical protein
MTLKQLGCFLIVLIASEGLIAQSSPSWLHLRCEENRYGLRKHSDSDQFRNDIVLRDRAVFVLRDRAVFVVSLAKSTFEGVKKWDSNVRSLPVSHTDARAKLKGSQSKLFSEQKRTGTAIDGRTEFDKMFGLI